MRTTSCSAHVRANVPRRWRVANTAVAAFAAVAGIGCLALGFPRFEFWLFVFGVWIGHEVTEMVWRRRWRRGHTYDPQAEKDSSTTQLIDSAQRGTQ